MTGRGGERSEHRTPRRSSRRRRRIRRLRRAALRPLTIAAVVAVVLAAAVALLAKDAYAVRGAMLTAHEALAGATAALVAGELEVAEGSVREARAAIERAEDSVGGPLWALAPSVPLAGRTPATVKGVVDVAGAAVDVADAIVRQAERVLGVDGRLDIRVVDRRVDLDTVAAIGALLEDVPIARLRAAERRLVSLPEGWVPTPVAEGRSEVLALANDVAGTLERTRSASSLLPSFLGAGGPRRYFLGMQALGEARGTGGLLGYYSILTVDNGRFSLGDPGLVDEDEGNVPELERGDDSGGPERITRLEGDGRPVETSAQFLARYGHVEADRRFHNANLDPDLPTTARVLVDLYEQRTGESLDGLILVDPVGLGILLEAIGPVAVPDAIRDDEGRLPAQVAPGEVAPLLLADVYEVYGDGKWQQRHAFLRTFAHEAFGSVFSGTWDGVTLGRQLGAAVAGRHIQVFSEREIEQRLLGSLGVSGEMRPASPRADLLAVTVNNSSGGKMDVHLGHEVRGELRLDLPGPVGHEVAVGRRSGSVEVTLHNPLPSSGMDLYIIGTCDRVCFDGPPGVNRTWFTVWAPEDTQLGAARTDAGAAPVAVSPIHGHNALDLTLETPPQSRRSFAVDLDGPVTVVRDGPDLVYRLTWWRQAKAIPDHLDFTIAVPDGWRLAGAALAGGGDGEGMGALGDGEPLRLEESGNGVRVTGSVDADLHLELRLRRALPGRVADWLRGRAF